MLKYTIFSFFLFFLFFSFSQDTNFIEINNQKWDTINLNTKIFRNGDSILYAQTNKQWLDCCLAPMPFQYHELHLHTVPFGPSIGPC